MPARLRLVPIVRPENDCLKSSSPKSPVELGVFSTARRLTIGCGKAVTFTCSMERPFPCRTLRRTLEAYPKTYNQKAGRDFLWHAVGSLISLSCGAILDVGFVDTPARDRGKSACCVACGTFLRPGDVILGDCLMSNWTGIVMLKERGFELVSRLNKAHRKADFRKGKRLGPG